MRYTFFSFVIGATILASSCSQPNSTVKEADSPIEQGQPLVVIKGTSWVLNQFIKEGVLTSVSTETPPTLVIEEDAKVNGSTSCNRYFGPVEIDGSKIKFGPLGVTKMLCPDTETETIFIEAINHIDSFQIEDQTLKLLKNGEITLVFSKEQ